MLDVGCGPGALTAELVRRLGPDAVTAIDPSPPFVAATAARFPRVDVRTGTAENLPFADDSFDVALAQLVVHFMADPVHGLAEMRRVTRPGGTVGACVWDFGGGRRSVVGLLAGRAGAGSGGPGRGRPRRDPRGSAGRARHGAGLPRSSRARWRVTVGFATSTTGGSRSPSASGPVGDYIRGLDDDRRAALREHCRELLPPAPFAVTGSAWSVTARV